MKRLLILSVLLFSQDCVAQEQASPDDASSDDWSYSSSDTRTTQLKTDDPQKVEIFRSLQKKFREEFFKVEVGEQQPSNSSSSSSFVKRPLPKPPIFKPSMSSGAPSLTKIELPKVPSTHTSSTKQDAVIDPFVFAKKGLVAQCMESVNKEKINDPDDTGNTLLHYAAEQPDGVLCKQLLEKGAAVNAKNMLTGDIPLHRACATGNIKTCYCLLRHNASFNKFNKKGEIPLHLAAEYGDSALWRTFVDSEAFFPKGVDIDALNYRTDDAPLHRACAQGNAEVASFLVVLGAHQELKNGESKTPLDMVPEDKKHEFVGLFHPDYKQWLKRALFFNLPDVVKTLLTIENAVSDSQLAYKHGFTACHVISSLATSEKELSDGLIAQGKKVAVQPTSYEDERNQCAILAYLGKQFPHIMKVKDKFGRTPLHVAAEWGRLEVCQILVEDYDVPIDDLSNDSDVLSPLEIAVCYNRHKLITYFIRELIKQTSVEHFIEQVNRLVRLAIKHNALESVHVLLTMKDQCVAKFAYPIFSDSIEHLFHEACLKGDLAMCKRLLKNGALPNEIVDSVESLSHLGGSITPLHCAAYGGHKDLCSWLLRQHVHKVSIDSVTDKQISALTCACMQNHGDVARFLVEQGAVIRSLDLYHASLSLMPYLYECVISWYKKLPEDERGYHQETFSPAGLLSCSDEQGRNLLHRCAEAGCAEKCSFFADYLIDWAARDSHGRTALHLACCPTEQNEQLRLQKAGRTVQVILENLEDDEKVIDIQDNEGRTALHYACSAQHGSAVAALLLDAGANKLIESNSGETPLSLMQKSKSPLTQKLLN